MFRPAPRMAAHNYKTWEIVMPKATHFRAASCEETDCAHYREGWETVVDETTDLGQGRAYYIRHRQTRNFIESKEQRNGVVVTVFRFPPGQRCFAQHEKALDRPQVHAARRGDWRGVIGERYIYDRPDQWREDLDTHLTILRRAQE